MALAGVRRRCFSGLTRNAYSATIDYRPSHVFAVVADVESYSQFVPWCTKSKVVEELSPREKLADLTVGFYGIAQETFRSHVILDPYRSVTALASSEIYSRSPLKRLKNVWTFEPVGENETKVTVDVEFEFHNAFYTRLSSHFLKRVSNLAMSSFVARCALVKPEFQVTETAEPPNLSDIPVLEKDIKQGELPRPVVVEQAIVDHSFRGIRDTFRSLASCSYFEEYEIEVLSHEFNRLTEGNAGKMSKYALGKFLQTHDQTALSTIFEAMDVDKNGTLTLREFVRGLSLITRGSVHERRFAWFKNTPDSEIPKEQVELAVMCTLIVRDVLARIFFSSTVSPYERPDAAASRLVAPVYRSDSMNRQALERLFASL